MSIGKAAARLAADLAKCGIGVHDRVAVSAACGHRDVCVRCRQHKHGEECATTKGVQP